MGKIFQIAQLRQPLLRRKAEPVAEIDGTVIERFDDSFAANAEADGAGIAATRIYVSLRVFILSIRPAPQYRFRT